MNSLEKLISLIPSLIFISLGVATFFMNVHYATYISSDYTERFLVSFGLLLIGLIGIQITMYLTRPDECMCMKVQQNE